MIVLEKYNEELTPIKYGPNAIKTASYQIQKGRNALVLHWHDRMELIYLRSGELEVGYASNIETLHSGEIYIIPPRTPHSAICKSDTAMWDVLMFDIRSFYNNVPLSCDVLTPIFEGKTKLKMVLKNQETAVCHKKIMSLADKNSFETIVQIYSLIDLLLKHALIEVGESTKNSHVIDEALAYIKDNLDKELTTKTLSEKFNYSEEHFCRLFKETTKVTPTTYIKINRLNKAVNLLSTTNHSVSEVSSICGFNEPNYFTRCFKAHFGKSPTEYLKMERSEKIPPSF